MPTARSRASKAFFLALGIAALMFLPFIIYDRGYFIYYGDFNVQQIPFYKLAHEAVRSGNIFWSFYTDLGANFIGSYSFYLLFSPFFWLTLPFPTIFLPHLMAPLLILKTACAALTAYLFLERFVRDRDYAVFGALLYAFSGWMYFNIFFNHFHEVAVFFPLLLLGVEKLVTEDNKGFFALAVGLNAMVNYWFFVGEVVFTVIYVLVRMTDKGWGMNLRRFIRLGVESVLGVGLACFALAPSVMALMGNPRTGTDSVLNGWNLWIYWQTQAQASVLQSLFFPPELPARLNFFPDSGAAWGSRSAWLPLVGLSGVLAYFFTHKKDWVKRILAISLVMALVPGLNSLFILLNHSYYARWFYMPILIMCLSTARALEESAQDSAPMLRGLKWCMIGTLVFTVVCGLTPKVSNGQVLFGLAAYPLMMWVYTAVSLVSVLITTALIARLRNHRRFKGFLTGGMALICLVFGIYYISNGKNNAERSNFIINSVIGGRELIDLPEEPFARMDAYDSTDNLGMFWLRPTIQAFHSIVPVSLMEFYPEVGVKRDVGSRPEAEFYALRPLLSVRWLFIEKDKSEQEPMPGYQFHSEQLGFNVYENENFLPMGLGYDRFVSREELDEISQKQRSNLMLRAAVLEDWDAIERLDDYMEWYDISGPNNFSYDTMTQDVEERRQLACYYFAHDNKGFTARSNLPGDTLMFFSVPYDKGWTATVNGNPVPVEKVNIGFMAALVPAGESEIRFEYSTPGLEEGAVLSGAALILFALYMVFWRIKGSKTQRRELDIQRALFLGEAVNLTWEEYLAGFQNKDARRQALQETLNQAGAVYMGEALTQEEQTLRFQLPFEE